MNAKSASAVLPTKHGDFRIIVWQSEKGKEPVAVVTPNLDVDKSVLVRVHSECMTGDLLGSYRCDCGQQKDKALEMISASKNGIFIYLKQEGRGIGLYEKIRAYTLQEQGYDTHEANILLGHQPDPREYSSVKKILNQLGIEKIRLITNNPSKINSLREYGFEITERVQLKIKSNKYNKKYLETKKVKFKHFLDGKTSSYFISVTGVKKSFEIRVISAFLQGYSIDPFLRIALGISVTNDILNQKIYEKSLAKLYKEILQHHPPIVPVLHYSFRKSKDYITELRSIKERFPYVKKILLNDLEGDYIETLQYATKFFYVHFPLNDSLVDLLNNPRFVRLVQLKKIVLIFDNSGGNGIVEEAENYKKKINLCLSKGINNIGIAGGFGPNNLQTYFSVKDYYKINFSVDAETNLQTNHKLDLKKVKQYLDKILNPTN